MGMSSFQKTLTGPDWCRLRPEVAEHQTWLCMSRALSVCCKWRAPRSWRRWWKHRMEGTWSLNHLDGSPPNTSTELLEFCPSEKSSFIIEPLIFQSLWDTLNHTLNHSRVGHTDLQENECSCNHSDNHIFKLLFKFYIIL